jgi:phenylpyruvate tautomerase PptA (4-oxalocrotonate tautomerase family)
MSREQKAQLAESLTQIVLDAELAGSPAPR